MIAADSLRDARKRLQSKTLFPVSLTGGGRAEASDRLASTSLTSRLSSLVFSEFKFNTSQKYRHAILPW